MILLDKDIKRFWSKVDIKDKDNCWEWKATDNGHGYGLFKFDGKMRPAHRIAYLIKHGSFPRAIHHTCHNKRCCNINHFQEMSRSEHATLTNLERDNSTFAHGLRNGAYTHPEKRPNHKRELNPYAKLTSNKARKIRELCKKNIPQKIISKMFGISQAQVSNINTNKQWAE